MNKELPVFHADLGMLAGDVFIVDDDVVMHVPPDSDDRFFNWEDLLIDNNEDFLLI